MGFIGSATCDQMQATVWQPGQVTADVVNAWYACTQVGYSGGLNIQAPPPAPTNDWITAGAGDVTPRPPATITSFIPFNPAPDPASSVVLRTADGRLVMSTPLSPLGQPAEDQPAAPIGQRLPWYGWLAIGLAVGMATRKN